MPCRANVFRALKSFKSDFSHAAWIASISDLTCLLVKNSLAPFGGFCHKYQTGLEPSLATIEVSVIVNMAWPEKLLNKLD